MILCLILVTRGVVPYTQVKVANAMHQLTPHICVLCEQVT